MVQPTVVHDFPDRRFSDDALPEHRGETIQELEGMVKASQGPGAVRIAEAVPDIDVEIRASLAADAGQFFTVKMVGELLTCSEPDCGQDTRLLANFNNGESHEQRPICYAHAHVLFADFMVGA